MHNKIINYSTKIMEPNQVAENLPVKAMFFSLVIQRPAVRFPAVILSDTRDIVNVKKNAQVDYK